MRQVLENNGRKSPKLNSIFELKSLCYRAFAFARLNHIVKAKRKRLYIAVQTLHSTSSDGPANTSAFPICFSFRGQDN